MMPTGIETNPECAHGKHRNCDGIGLDWDTDTFVDCPCRCHDLEKTGQDQ